MRYIWHITCQFLTFVACPKILRVLYFIDIKIKILSDWMTLESGVFVFVMTGLFFSKKSTFVPKWSFLRLSIRAFFLPIIFKSSILSLRKHGCEVRLLTFCDSAFLLVFIHSVACVCTTVYILEKEFDCSNLNSGWKRTNYNFLVKSIV